MRFAKCLPGPSGNGRLTVPLLGHRPHVLAEDTMTVLLLLFVAVVGLLEAHAHAPDDECDASALFALCLAWKTTALEPGARL